MRSITTWKFEAKEPFDLARTYAACEGTALLYSGGSFDSATSSFLCLFPIEKITLKASCYAWQELKQRIGSFGEGRLPIPQWVGYLGYEMGCFADIDRTFPSFNALTPDCCFFRPSVVVHFEHQTQRATLFAEKPVTLRPTAGGSKQEPPLSPGFISDTLESYVAKIARAKEWILDGEIYQVNLSQEIQLEGKGDPFTHFEQSFHLNPSPFAAYLNCGPFAIVSTSPERFISKRSTRIETRPIKGTAARGKTAQEDKAHQEALLASPKERSELLMITDLMRSDLSKISRPGSVKAKEIWKCEAYTNVFHLLSILEAEVDPESHPIEVIRSLFPGGSITGCPKLRAMEAIAALEGRPRGVYTGSIGYLAANGDFDFNIAIRTLIVHAASIQLQLGGAIVIDSDPIQEFKETLYKGLSLFKALGIREIHGHSLF